MSTDLPARSFASRAPWRPLPLGLLFAAALLLPPLGGCASRPAPLPATLPADAGPTHIDTTWDEAHLRHLPIFAGRDGTPLSWQQVLAAMGRAEVVFLAEQHNDALGHAVQRELLADTLAADPQRYALSLEMLERDEQAVTDDYLEGLIDTKTFVTLTHSENWAGEGSWATWYQPIIDVAKAAGAPVIAANAPRRYVRLARTHGYERLEQLPRERRALFDLPASIPQDAYRERFIAMMTRSHGHGSSAPSDPQAALQRAEASFRSQWVWDATMAGSILAAHRATGRTPVHLVGQFHTDFQGGTLTDLQRRAPRLRVLTISLQRRGTTTLDERDRDRADIVIHTGPAPQRARAPRPATESTPETAPTPEAPKAPATVAAPADAPANDAPAPHAPAVTPEEAPPADSAAPEATEDVAPRS